MGFEFNIVNQNDKDYSELLNSCTDALFFHTPEYLQLLANHLDASVLIFISYTDGVAQVALPFLQKEASKGKVLNSLPYFGSNGSFVVPDANKNREENLKKELLEYVTGWCKSNAIVSVNIVTNYFVQQDKEWYEQHYKPDFVSVRYGQVTPLPLYTEQYEEKLLHLFEDPRPRNIRKALKSGIQIVKDETQEAWDFLYRVHKENMEGIGAPVKKVSFFAAIPTNIPSQNYSLYLAVLDQKPIACMLLFHSGKTIEYYTPGTLSEYRNLQPSALIVFEAMKEMAAKGYKWWNWGGSSSRESGVYDFKKKWGAVEMPYYHLTKVLNPDIYNCTANELLEEYPGFFVVPFNQLKNAEN